MKTAKLRKLSTKLPKITEKTAKLTKIVAKPRNYVNLDQSRKIT